MKHEICKAFCDSITVREVPAGIALSTTVASINGDPIGFYAIEMPDGRFRLEDSGLIIPYLYAVGADLENDARREMFEEILNENNAIFDDETLEISSQPVFRDDLPNAAVGFVSLLLRVSDLSVLSQEKVASTFKMDATMRLKERLAGQATLREAEPVSATLAEWEPDVVIEAPSREPVAVFLVQTDHRALEALLLQADAEKLHSPLSVIALLERDTSVSKKTRVKVANRLEAAPIFDGGEMDAIDRIARSALGKYAQALH